METLNYNLLVLVCLITWTCLTRGQIQFPDTLSSESSSKHTAILHYCTQGDVDRQRWEVPRHLMTNNQSTAFLFKVKNVNCSMKPVKERKHSLQVVSENEESELRFQQDGYLVIGSSADSDYFHTNQYCIARLTDNEIVVKTCEPDCSEKEPCIRKCCPPGSLYSFSRRGCSVSTSSKWTPKIFQDIREPDNLVNSIELKDIYLRVRLHRTWAHNCLDPYSQLPRVQLMPYSQRRYDEIIEMGQPPASIFVFRFRVGKDGKVRFRNARRKWVTLPHDDYCVDGMTFSSEADPHAYNNTLEEDILFTCPPPVDPEVREVSEYFGIMSVTTSMFALLTLLVYMLLLDKQTIHGWTTMAHSGSVFLFFVFLGTAHLSKGHQELIKTGGCKFIGTMAHFFFLSTFCWLLMISFDLWSTFRSISAASRKKGLSRFLWYCVFAWGVPLLIVTIAWTLDAVYRNDENSEAVVPLYGEDFCYISHHFYWEFIYGPNAFLLMVNFILFVFTSIKLYQFQKSTRIATQTINKERQSFQLFLKLFFVVGALWVFEILSFSVSGSDVPWYWQVLDTLNLLQPIAIFTIFVLKWEVINALHERYTVLRPILYPARRLLQFICPKEAKVKPTVSEASQSTRFNSSLAKH